MELQFLTVLDYRLGVTEHELLANSPTHLAPSRTPQLFPSMSHVLVPRVRSRLDSRGRPLQLKRSANVRPPRPPSSS